MFELTIVQKNYNRAKFRFDSIDDAAEFVKNCMNFDDGETAYTLKYDPVEGGVEDGI